MSFMKKMSCEQSLETIGKVNGIKGSVRNTADYLPGIKAELVRLDGSCQFL